MTSARVVVLIRLSGFVLALASYWAPWVAHPAAGLAVAEVDFAEFPKFMPQVRSGELSVWRESFYMPLFALAVGLVGWAARTPTRTLCRPLVGRGGRTARHTGHTLPRSLILRLRSAPLRTRIGEGDQSPPLPSAGGWTGVRWLVRVLALALPITPSIFNVFEGGEFQTQIKLSAIVFALIALTPWLRRAPPRMLSVALAGVFVFGALAPTWQFFQMKPALDAIYHQPVQIGWGVWAGLFGFGLLAISSFD